MKFIPLTNSDRLCLVDDEDYDRIIALNTNWYIVLDHKRKRQVTIMSTKHFKKGRKIILPRFILGLDHKNKMQADHKDLNICNNQRNNLREADHWDNLANVNKRSNNTTGEKGICIFKNGFMLQVKSCKKRHVSYHKTIEEAVVKRNEIYKEMHEEFSRV